MVRYVPMNVPVNVKALGSFLTAELRRIENALGEVEEIKLVELHVEPPKPRDGMIILADGTDFDPGAGQGFYGRYNATWNKLG